MQSIDTIETYAYGTSIGIVCNNIIKLYKKLLTLIILHKKTYKRESIIQIDHKFLIIHTEY